MIRGKYLRERKAMRIKRRFKFLVVVTIILIIYKILCDSFSLFESQATSDANIDIAFFLVNDRYSISSTDETSEGATPYTRSIKIADIQPGDTKEYTIWVSNYGFYDANGQLLESDHVEGAEKKVADTNIKYNINIKTTTNLPLEYKLTTTTGVTEERTETTILRESESPSDTDGMYFKNIYSANEKKLLFNNNSEGIAQGQQDTYKLQVTFPNEGEWKDARYQDIVEYIEVSIDAEQII